MKMDLKKVCEAVDWIYLTQCRVHWQVLLNAIMNLSIPYKAKNFLTLGKTLSFSRISFPLKLFVCYGRIHVFSKWKNNWPTT